MSNISIFLITANLLIFFILEKVSDVNEKVLEVKVELERKMEKMEVVLRKDVEDVKVEGKLLKESVERVSESRSIVLDGLKEQV